uniref:Uncharacterized protein n=1 Tax=Romanomermis culicivorax TaxID=13658 RepID=A0A915KKI6_ROMCU
MKYCGACLSSTLMLSLSKNESICLYKIIDNVNRRKQSKRNNHRQSQSSLRSYKYTIRIQFLRF